MLAPTLIALVLAGSPLVPTSPPSVSGRAWGPEQVVGPPDSKENGDYVTAWASKSADGQPEWLRLEFAREVDVAMVRIHETYNAGAVVAIEVSGEKSDAVTIFTRDAKPQPAGWLEAKAQAPARGRFVKLLLDSVTVKGWNEIDAVELLGTDGSRQWATAVTASTSYADSSAAAQPSSITTLVGKRVVVASLGGGKMGGVLDAAEAGWLVLRDKAGAKTLVNLATVLWVAGEGEN